MALKQIGVQAVFKGTGDFEKGAKLIQEAARQTAERIKANMKEIPTATQAAGKGFDELLAKGKDLASQFLSQIPVIGNFSDEIIGMVNPTMLAVAAIAALTVEIVKLGIEGGKIKGVQQSFETLIAPLGDLSSTLLPNLRAAVKGTVTDFELMRTTNVALAGASRDFATQFGNALPKVLELARIQAQATGQDVDYLVNSLVTGIKRASPMLIDNTGIVLKVGQANEALAQKLGKSVEALTAEEKQIAVLNAVLEAGTTITGMYANAQEYASTKAARLQTTLSNMGASIQVALEPIASAVLDLVNLLLSNIEKILAGIMTIVQPIINIISAIVNAITSTLSPVINFIGDLLGQVFGAIGSIVETVLAPFQLLIEVFAKVGSAVMGFVVAPLRGLLDFLMGVVNFIIGLARGMLKAGAALIGALASGILRAANTILMPAVIAVATFIADFLVGQSPPPKGPLSHIDDGGAATMEAWLAGFVGVGLQPVEDVAAEVTGMMGDIARMSISQVDTRLRELDKALQPFSDRLAIVKANFEALQPVTDAAFSIIDRQMDKAVQALAMGAEGSAEQVRQLDAQRQSLEDYIAAQQESIDQAQIQYALAQAAQARERAMLEIRKKQLEIDKITDPVEREKKQKELAKEKEKAGAGTTPEMGGAGGDFSTPKPPGEGGFVDELKGAFEGGFDMGGGQEELGKFKQGQKMLQDQFDRIGKGLENSALVKGIKDAVDGIAKLFDPTNPDGWVFKVLQWLAEQSDTSNTNGIVGWFFNLPTTLRNAVTELPTVINESIVKPMVKEFNRAFDMTDPESLGSKAKHFFMDTGEGTLMWILTAPLRWLTTEVITPLVNKFGELTAGMFDLSNPDSFASKASYFFMGTGEGSLLWILTAPLRWFAESVLNPLFDWFYQVYNGTINPDNPDSFAAKAALFFQGDGDGTLKGTITSIGNWLKQALANPFIAGLNAVIGALEDFINNSLVSALNAIANTMADLLQSVGDTGSDIYKRLREFGQTKVTLGRLPMLATGGLMGKGFFQAGEKGKEIGMASQPFAMFSNRFVKAIDLFADVMAKPMPFPVVAGGNTSNYNNNNDSQVNNFYSVRGTEDAARRIAMLRAFR